MEDHIGSNIVKLLDYLERNDEFEDSLLIFVSENRDEGAAYEAILVMRPNLMDAINTYYEDSDENFGNYNSFA